MVYRGPGFLAVAVLDPPPPPVSKLDYYTGRLSKRDKVQTEPVT
jgi:hypothetical protein